MMAYFLWGVGGGGHTKAGLPHINVWLDSYVPLVGIRCQYLSRVSPFLCWQCSQCDPEIGYT